MKKRVAGLGAALIMSAALVLACGAGEAKAEKKPVGEQDASAPRMVGKPAAGHKLDTTGRKRVGKASYYSGKFAGKKMADGTRMNPQRDNAASKTLPLGTTAKVTNLDTGQSAVVTIKDRGPYVDGRIVDLSPSTARQVGITREDGVADVEVTPIKVPLPDGSVKVGEAGR